MRISLIITVLALGISTGPLQAWSMGDDPSARQGPQAAWEIAPPDNTNADRPGWTGRTLVAGSHSTLKDNADATRRNQTGQF